MHEKATGPQTPLVIATDGRTYGLEPHAFWRGEIPLHRQESRSRSRTIDDAFARSAAKTQKSPIPSSISTIPLPPAPRTMEVDKPGTPCVFLTAEWRHLLMVNYVVDAVVLEPLVPTGTELHLWQGEAFVSVVGFRFLKTKVRGLPIPFHRDFDEVNLRFYVRRRVENEWRKGVVFIKEIVPRRAIAFVARWVYNENYVRFR